MVIQQLIVIIGGGSGGGQSVVRSICFVTEENRSENFGKGNMFMTFNMKSMIISSIKTKPNT